ncbi:unnamed protein product [Ambrosiozyma monospora]|uniref:Unnamed protein product n=1 Tax=Ambrosiozyma monospora TaxID=43982 RepID=A0ACB5T8Q7_AMBMO|nr:unnamed protein product [Ambrosiozyma monospora]
MQEFNNLVADLKNKIQETDPDHKLVANFDRYLVSLVAQSICIIGSRSLSVIEGGALELCGGKLRKVLGLKPDENEEEETGELDNNQFEPLDEAGIALRQSWLIEGVLRLWNNEPRIGYLILEKMKNKGFLKPYQLLESLFKNNENLIAVTECYATELLNRLINDSIDAAAGGAEGGEEDKAKLLQAFNECVIRNVNLFVEKVEIDFSSENIDKFTEAETIDQDDEIRWGLRNLLDLLKMYLRNYLSILDISGLKKLIEEEASEKTNVKEHLNELIESVQKLN